MYTLVVPLTVMLDSPEIKKLAVRPKPIKTFSTEKHIGQMHLRNNFSNEKLPCKTLVRDIFIKIISPKYRLTPFYLIFFVVKGVYICIMGVVLWLFVGGGGGG